MKISILCNKGMAGHVMAINFGQESDCEVHYTSREVNDEQSFFLNITDFKRREETVQAIKADIRVTTRELGKEKEEMIKKKGKIIPEYQIVLDRINKNHSTDFQGPIPAFREMFIHFKRMERKHL